jgi:hypothetical protein
MLVNATFSPDGSKILTTSGDGTAMIFPCGVDSNAVALKLTGHR